MLFYKRDQFDRDIDTIENLYYFTLNYLNRLSLHFSCNEKLRNMVAAATKRFFKNHFNNSIPSKSHRIEIICLENLKKSA